MASRKSLSGEGETNESLIQKKAPEPSSVSMKSDLSMCEPINYSSGDTSDVSLIQKKAPEPSSVSMKSDQSMCEPINYSSGDTSADVSAKQEESNSLTRKQLDSIFKDLEHKILSELNMFKRLLNPDYSEYSEKEEEDEGQSIVREGLLKVTLQVLRKKNHTDLATTLQTKYASFCLIKYKSRLKETFQRINEGISNQGSSIPLHEIYTELYITEGGSGEVNNEHEVRQIEKILRAPGTQEATIKCNDIFKGSSGQMKAIRTVLTKGVAGIGKTVSVQKFILDWTEGKGNSDVHFIFPLPFRELNLMKEKNISLIKLLHNFFMDTQELSTTDFQNHKVILIFDGLDECRLPLDFQNNVFLHDMTESAPVDVLLTNLIMGNLLPSALIWITSRPAAANKIPPECVDQVTEVRGFNDPQKDEYFKKRISDQSLASRIITHVKSSRSLYIMCHIPVFCWISATVLERMLSKAESGEVPKTLTQMFTHFLIYQIKLKTKKYDRKCEADLLEARNSILSLGKLAFEQLEKGNLIFYMEDLRHCGIDVTEASVYSGVCTQIFREEFGLHLGKVYSFVHLSVQEFIAALFKFLFVPDENTKCSMTDLLKSEVDKALQNENGHWDLYLRFLLGLSLESNQTLLRDILTQTGSKSVSKQEIVKYVKMKIRENPSPEKSINLFHCLNELNDQSLVQEVQKYISRTSDTHLSGVRLSPAQWSALVFVLLNSEEELDEFKLSKYEPSEDGLQKLLPVIKASRKSDLSDCNLTENSCPALASVLCSNPSSLRELNLSKNNLKDSGVKLLSTGLQNPHCKLQILKLSHCSITKEGCAALASALKTNPSHLKELNLKCNTPGDSEVKLLADVLRDSHCKLEKLQLECCHIGEEGCAALASALRSNPSHLRELNLSRNKLNNSGVNLLSDLLKDQHCKLNKLQLCDCIISDNGCDTLVSALISNPSHLRELDLSRNKVGDSGVKLLSDLLKDPHCKLKKLQLECCSIGEEDCSFLVSALRSNPSHLIELNLNYNTPGDLGVKQLSKLLNNPNCKLEKLMLCHCSIPEEGCVALVSALRSNPSHLRELKLSDNKSGDSGCMPAPCSAEGLTV